MWQLAEQKLRQDPAKQEALQRYDELLEQKLGTGLAPIGTQKRRDQMLEFVSTKVEQLTNKDKQKHLGKFTDKVEGYFQRAIHAVIKCKDIINAASQPCLLASIACAGVMLLLSTYVQAFGEREIFYKQISDLSWAIFRITEYEELLWGKGGIPPNGEVKTLLSDACANILYIQAHSASYLDGSKFKKGLRDAFKIDDWQNMRSNLDLAESALRDCAQRDNFKVDQNTNQIVRDIQQRQQRGVIRSNYESFLGKLYQNAYSYEDSKNRNGRPVKGTCVWFTTHDKFTLWNDHVDVRDGATALLYVTADPGCGKSVLSRHLIDTVLPRPGRAVCYSFFKDDFQDQKSACKAVCALLHQLLCSAPDTLNDDNPIMKNYKATNDGFFSSFAALWKSFEFLAKRQPTVCVFDALDECDAHERSLLLEAIASAKIPTLSILATSRPYDHIRREFTGFYGKSFPSIHLQGDHGSTADAIVQEIELVVESRADKLASVLELTNEEHNLLRRELRSIPNRTYLWITLVFDGLMTSGLTKRGMMKLSRQLPSGINEAYEKILSNSQDVEKTRRLLHIVLAAHRPYTLTELSIAMSAQGQWTWSEIHDGLVPTHRMRNYIRDICGLFVLVVDERVYLLHQTAREFLLTKDANPSRGTVTTPQAPWQHSMSLQDSHSVLAEVTITCLMTDCSSYCESMAAYSDQLWFVHHRQSPEVHQEMRFDAVLELCSRLSSLAHSEEASDFLYINREHLAHPEEASADYRLHHLYFNPLHIATSFRLLNFIARSFQMDDSVGLRFRQNIDVPDRHGLTPLCKAVLMEAESVVEVLLDAKACVNQRNADFVPLVSAASMGNLEMVRMLLDRGADVNLTTVYGRSALSDAARLDRKAVVQLLIENGADVNPSDQYHDIPLLEAAASRHVTVVEILLDNGARIDAKDRNGWTALSNAAKEGCVAVVQLLLDRGAEIDSPNIDLNTPLAGASQYGMEEAVHILLSRGARADARDVNGDTPLSFAAAAGHLGCVKALVEEGCADVDTQNDAGETAVWLAALNGWERVLDYLLERGASIEHLLDGGDLRARFAAITEAAGRETVVGLLLEEFECRTARPNPSHAVYGRLQIRRGTPISVAYGYWRNP